MKNLSFLPVLLLIAIIACCLNACNKDDIDVKYDITGDWKVKSYKTSAVITKTDQNTWPQFHNGDVTVSFTETDLTSGKISGIKVTNSFSGDYTIGNNGAISISKISQTKINEPEWGRLFDSISNAESYEIRHNLLIIYYNQKKNNITLERMNK